MNKQTENTMFRHKIPHGPPVKSVSDYFQSKMHSFVAKKYPLWDSSGREGGLERWRAENEASDVITAKEQLKPIHEAQRMELDRKWSELKEKQLMLRNAFVQFNEFVCENDEKRKRASRSLSQDKESLVKKSEEVESLVKQLEQMNKVQADMELFLKSHSLYREYLESVVEISKEFKTPADIVNRFKTLNSTKIDLAERQEKDLARVDKICKEMISLNEEKQLQIMEHKNKLAELKNRHEKAKKECKKWETILIRANNITSENESELSSVKDSIWHLYNLMCKHKGLKARHKRQDYEKQLISIMLGLTQLKEIVKLTKEKHVNGMNSNRRPSSGFK